MNRSMSIHQYGILIFLAIALSVILFHMTVHLAPLASDNELTFITSNTTLEDYMELRREWRPRVLSNATAHLSSALAKEITDTTESHLKTTVGIYSAGWLLLINVSLILGFGRRALVFMWGIFAAIAFGYAPGLVIRVYPWDMPALFFFTLFLVCYHRGLFNLLPVVILVGALFKETTAVLCIALLFLPIPWWSRLKLIVITGVFFVGIKGGVDLAVGIPLPFTSPSIRSAEYLRLTRNLSDLLSTSFYEHPVWINAGSLFALMILPGRNRDLLMLKCVAACFAVSLFVFGEIKEFRIWFEAIPLAVYGIVMTFENWELPNKSVESDK